MKKFTGWPSVLVMISPHITAFAVRRHFSKVFLIELP